MNVVAFEKMYEGMQNKNIMEGKTLSKIGNISTNREWDKNVTSLEMCNFGLNIQYIMKSCFQLIF